ncbi:MAG: chemotaxis protein CheW [Chloroflexi bacterium]|nr:chemotaxis protein CheW [Chloroflexota bacterium]
MDRYPISGTASLSSAHSQFLEQLNDEQFWNYAVELAYAAPTDAMPTDEYLVCKLEKGSCILPLATLREVVPPPHQFTLLPAAPPWMLGVGAWRGETIAIIDLNAYLSNTTAPLHSDGMLLVVQLDGLTLGLFISAVGSMITLAVEHMELPEQVSAWHMPPCAGAIKGVYRDMTSQVEALVLDVPIIVNDMVQHIKNNRRH